MRLSILPAVVLLASASSALAQMPPPRHYDSSNDGSFHPADDASAVDGPGNGLQLELNVFRLSTTYSSDSIFSLATLGGDTGAGTLVGALLSTLQPLVLVGYQFDQNALMLGVGVAQITSTTYFAVSPTYRRYMSPLRTGKISAFGEGGVTISVVAPSGSTNWGLGIDVGGGAEWLFVKNFGLFGKALISYGHVNLSSGTGGGSSNLDAAGLEGDVGLSVHL